MGAIFDQGKRGVGESAAALRAAFTEVCSVFVARLAVCYLHLGCSRSKRGQCFLA